MNILASYNWIKEYLKTDLSAEDFAREFSLRSMSVEKIDSLEKNFRGMVVGVIKEIKEHPNANKLRIAVTDIGDKTVEIVCGGSNLSVGQKVFVALPGSFVKWHGEGDLVELKETEIRGVKSIGMICAPAEVEFEKLQGADHEIWDLSAITDAAAGTPIAKALGLDDTLFDIEITTNRPDCMSIIGLAREGAAAVEGEFGAPIFGDIGWRDGAPPVSTAISVSIDSKLCPRYMAAVVKNVKVGPSPWWLQKKLLLAGHRPINNVVDVTNYILHVYGQPLHAFDADKIRGGKIVVREARKGEKMKALDGKEYELSKKNLVIADAEGPMAVAGVMGGEESSTTSATTTVVFEAATFDPVSVRRTARDLNLYSDSQLVFEKGLSTEGLQAALIMALGLLQETMGGELDLEGVIDVRRAPYKPLVFLTTAKKIRERIGVEISDEVIEKILTRLGFSIEKKGSKLSVTVPFWRDHDIEGEIDLTEEVARMYGYHLMPAVLPALAPPPAQDDVAVIWEGKIKRLLAACGHTEFFGYSFVDAKDLEKYGLSPMDAVKVFNPLSEELGYLRPSLIPGVLRDIERNQANAPHAHIFELSRVYIPKGGTLPEERYRLVIAKYGFEDVEAAFMTLKGTLVALGRETGIEFHLNRLGDDPKWHSTRSAKIFVEIGGDRREVGVFGQVAHAFQKPFGVEEPVFMIDLDLETLLPRMRSAMHYEPLLDYPVSKRDISFAVPEHVLYEDVAVAIKEQIEGGSLVRGVDLADIYRGVGVDEGKKSLTITITIGAFDRTLTSEDIDYALKKIVGTLEAKFGAALRG